MEYQHVALFLPGCANIIHQRQNDVLLVHHCSVTACAQTSDTDGCFNSGNDNMVTGDDILDSLGTELLSEQETTVPDILTVSRL
jgi:hypothetical protein